MPPRIIAHALLVITLAPACATGSMTQAEGVDGGLAGDSDDSGGDDLPNPDPTFDSADDGVGGSTGGASDAAGDDNQEADTGSQDDGGSTSSPADPSEGSTSSGDATGAESTDDGGGESTGEASTGGMADSLDVSGWTIVQTDSASTFVLPPNTILEPGMRIVIGRASSFAGFTGYWGVTLGNDVVFFSGVDEFPVINGDETYRVLDETGALVDGPTPALELGSNAQRDDAAMAASDPAAWTVSLDPSFDATPGQTEAGPAAIPTLVITEVSDTVGNGAYVHEFVELTYVGS